MVVMNEKNGGEVTFVLRGMTEARQVFLAVSREAAARRPAQLAAIAV